MTAESVRFEQVTKRFGAVTAVDNLTLHIQPGEFMVLVGPSGCGKTTALRMLAGLEDPTEGEIYIGERCVNDVSPRDRDIAMVFQNYALYPHMRVYDNIAFGLRLRELKGALWQLTHLSEARAIKSASTPACAKSPRCWKSRTCCTACPKSCRAGSGSVSRLRGPLCASRKCS